MKNSPTRAKSNFRPILTNFVLYALRLRRAVRTTLSPILSLGLFTFCGAGIDHIAKNCEGAGEKNRKKLGFSTKSKSIGNTDNKISLNVI